MGKILIDPFELAAIEPHVVGLSPRQVYVEIGAWQGGSVSWFGHRMSPGATLICVEIEPKAELRAALSVMRAEGYDAHLVHGSSQSPGTKQQVVELLAGRTIDCLLIDGDHRLPKVASDASRYSLLVRKGGLVIFHDCGICCSNAIVPDRMGINAVWQWMAKRRRNLLVQARHGTGLVWM